MKHQEKSITSIGQLIELLGADIGEYSGPVWFRGHGNAEWRLEPRLLRSNPVPSETHLLNRFRQNATLLLAHRPQNEFDWLFIMQHYGKPTRLLDWSESP